MKDKPRRESGNDLLKHPSAILNIRLSIVVSAFAIVGGYILMHSSAATNCTSTVSSVATAQSAVDSAAGGSIICMAAGTYGQINFSGTHTSNVNFMPDPAVDPNGAGKVTFTGISITGSYITVRNFYVNGGVYFGYPANHDTVDHSNVNNPGGVGIAVDGQVLSQTVPGVHDIIISGNKIHDDCQSGSIVGCEADGVNMNGWGNITITGNEFYNLIQEPSQAAHTDIMQSYNANNGQSSGLTFTNNYMHDNNTEGFFIKDGPVSNVNFSDNLCLRDPSSAHELAVYDITNLVMRNNTCWANTGIVLESTFNTGTAAIDHNVMDTANNLGSWTVTKSYNIYGEQGFTSPFSSLGTGESINASPGFMNTAVDDYRLSTNPNGIGVDWRPTDQNYGPMLSASSPKPGDLNGDNTVNITDLSILLSNYNTSNAVADINKDGTVNILDLSILLSNYGT